MRKITKILWLSLCAIVLSAPGPAPAQDGGKTGGEAATTDAAEKEKEKDAGTSAAGENRPESLTVASWGGAYTEAQKRAYFTPFESESGISIKTVSHQGSFAPLIDKDAASPAGWDIVDLNQSALEAGCKEGTLTRIKREILANSGNGDAPPSDFIPGSLHDCGVASVAWSSAIVFDKRAFKKGMPQTAADFFDVKRFPGPRAIPRNPRYIVELSLMADGVKSGDVYTTLETGEGLERAFKKLDVLKNDINWWHKAYQPVQLLAARKASMALAFNGRIFSAIVADNRPFGIIWDAQLYQLDYWAVPSASKHKKASFDFIAFASRPENLARQASWFPYGPVRKSAIALVGKHPEIDVDMTAYLPTAPKNFERALGFNPDWWKRNAARVETRYLEWIDSIDGSTSFEDEQNRP